LADFAFVQVTTSERKGYFASSQTPLLPCSFESRAWITPRPGPCELWQKLFPRSGH